LEPRNTENAASIRAAIAYCGAVLSSRVGDTTTINKSESRQIRSIPLVSAAAYGPLCEQSSLDSDRWELWGVLSLLNPRPAILVYAREATFLLWSGIIELGL
jgi:hypothetical protein